MADQDFDTAWHSLSQEVITGIKQWRLDHPKATFAEIETALDQRLARLRSQMLRDAALASPSTEWKEAPVEQKPACEKCGTPLQARGRHKRSLQTLNGHQ